MLDTFSEKLLCELQAERRLTERQTETLRSLVRQGLAFEQVALASGLLNEEAFFALLEIVSGLPSERSMSLEPMPLTFFMEDQMREFACIPFRKQKSNVEIAFSDPNTRVITRVRGIFAEHELRVIPVVIAQSAFRRSLDSRQRTSAASILRSLNDFASRNSVFHVRLVGTGPYLQLTDDAYQTYAHAPMIRTEALSGLQRHMKRRGAASGWSLDYAHQGTHPVLHLTRHPGLGEHPTDWASSAIADGADMTGMTVLVRHDPYLAKRLEGLDDAETHRDWGRRELRKYRADSEEEQELAMHAALAGEPVLAVSADDSAWWEPVSQAGIPVRVCRAHVSPEGRAWEIWQQ